MIVAAPLQATSADLHEVITFYSYKGGTGRTMALANIACLLGQGLTDGKRVLAIDWDLEAPGLHHYLAGQGDSDALCQRAGVVELFTSLQKELNKADDTNNEEDSISKTMVDAIPIADFIRPALAPNVDLMPAGCMDEKYQSRLIALDWEGMYKRCPGIYRSFARRLAREYAMVLLDSRTGMTDISGICTTLLPDKLVVVFTPNRQSLTGIEALIRRSTEYRQGSKDLRPLMVYPLPSRIDNQFETLRNQWRHGDGRSRH
jgi:eukaryotic-like serine/threonine-protein kinase